MKSIPLFLLFWGCTLAAYAVAPAYGLRPEMTTTVDHEVIFDTIDVNSIPPALRVAAHLILVVPEEGAKLNYTQIMFEHPQVSGAEQYLLEVALDDDGTPFAHPVVSQIDSSIATMLGNFEFGKKYVWRYAGLHNKAQLGWQGPYRFETLYNACIDTNQYRVRIVQNEKAENAGGLVMLDMARCINRSGNVVWFLPDSTTRFCTPPMMMQDLRMTNKGTVTLLNGKATCEKDLNGKLLWQSPVPVNNSQMGPNGISAFGYHHCFKKLNSGNYMALDLNTFVNPALPANKALVSYEILKEFNAAGEVVWKWSSESYFDTAELEKLGLDKPDPLLNNRMAGGHLNAFDVDEKNGFVYAGFRNVSRVIKIDKKTGKVVCAWGDNVTYHGAPNADGFFSKQHGLTLLHDGSIAVFSNNAEPAGTQAGPNSSSGVAIFTQPTKTENSRLLWKYDCAFDATNNLSHSGGNVDELNNDNLLVCMGAVNRVFEITRSKKIVWNALIEKHEDYDSSWHAFAVYRAHYASSLYPCYFTVQTSNRGVKIFNDGSEADSYQVSMSSASGNYKKQFSTAVIAPQKSAAFYPTPGLVAANDNIEVTVTSKTNPAFKRVINIP